MITHLKWYLTTVSMEWRWMCYLIQSQDTSLIPPRTRPHMAGKPQRMKRGTVQRPGQIADLKPRHIRETRAPCGSSRPCCVMLRAHQPATTVQESGRFLPGVTINFFFFFFVANSAWKRFHASSAANMPPQEPLVSGDGAAAGTPLISFSVFAPI